MHNSPIALLLEEPVLMRVLVLAEGFLLYFNRTGLTIMGSSSMLVLGTVPGKIYLSYLKGEQI